MVQIGALFPQTEIGTDPAAIRDYAQAVEGMGCAHLLAYEHVLGANTDRPDRARGFAYTHRDQFHEPFVLLAFVAAATSRLGLATDVLVLPQRQTALVAKQAAALDVLSGGRLRLGVGIGWNAVEFEALGEDFRNRGARVVEQVRLMRRLWTHDLVTFEGRWHRVTDAGINPLPVQRPIPVWMGGGQGGHLGEPRIDRILRRMGRLADGWMLNGPPTDEIARRFDRMREHARAAGRAPAAIGLEGAVAYGDGDPDGWRRTLDRWKGMGATHVTLQTRGAGFASGTEHVAALRRMVAALAA